MKTRGLIFSLIGLLLFNLGAWADNKKGLSDRHELSISYGAFPITEWGSTYTNAVKYIISFGSISESDGSSFGAVNLDYNYRINKIIGIGAGVSYNYTKSNMNFKFLGENYSFSEYNNFLSIMPKVKFNWINLPKFTLYTSAGAGLGIDFYNYTNRENGADENVSGTTFLVAFQVSPIGIEIGKKVCFFMEGGIGTSGSVIGGIRGKF